MKAGDKTKGYCKCGSEVDCIIKEYSNGTFHAHGRCPKCQKQGAFQQRNTGQSLDDFDHRLLGIKSAILGMQSKLDREEAICRMERLSETLWKEVDQ